MRPWASAVLGDLQALPESEAAKLIIQALVSRPSLAQPVVAAVCPELTFAPSKALTDRRVVGRIKSFCHNTGYGFISCPELFPVFSSDVFLHKAQLGGFTVHQEVNFAVFLNQYNKPQAYDLAPSHSPRPHSPKAHSDCFEGAGTSGAAASAAALAAAAAAAAPPPTALRSGPPGDANVLAASARQRAAAAPARPPPPPVLPPDWGRQLVPERPTPPLPRGLPEEQCMRPRIGSGTSPSAQLDEPLGTSCGRRRYAGRIKSFSRSNGFGFIACPELKETFGRDVYLHYSQLSGFSVGQQVSFALLLNASGHPQASDLGASCSSLDGFGGVEHRALEGAGGKAMQKSMQETDDLFQGATCVICREVLHRATSAQPCLHSFCSSCLGRWLWTASRKGQPQCPVCREVITGATRNSTLEGLIDGLLRAHPERARPAEELAALDSRDVLRMETVQCNAGVFTLLRETYDEFTQRIDSGARRNEDWRWGGSEGSGSEPEENWWRDLAPS